MFINRHLTQGIVERVGDDLQAILWSLVDKLPSKGIKQDYLQVFDLETRMLPNCRVVQRIQHKQEMPEYQSIHHFFVNRPINAKIYIIDDESHCTMLFSDEY